MPFYIPPSLNYAISNSKQYCPPPESPTSSNMALRLHEMILGLKNSSVALNAHHTTVSTPIGWYREHVQEMLPLLSHSENHKQQNRKLT